MKKSNLPDKELKVMVIKMHTDLRQRMDEHRKLKPSDWNVIKYQTEVIIKLKNIPEGFNSRINETKAQISELKNIALKITHTKQQNEKSDIKQNNIIGVPEGKEKGPEKSFEEMK